MKNTEKDIQMLGPQVALEGTLVFEGTLFMNGHIKGTIESREGTIVVGENAVVHADIFVRNANLNGEIKGSVRATGRIELHPPARVYGDLYAPNVIIDAGVIFEGKCTIKPKDDAAGEAGQMLAINAAETAIPMRSPGKWKTSFSAAKGKKKNSCAQA
jgi:cytoskeletal protein CcmA (bactofilin family)